MFYSHDTRGNRREGRGATRSADPALPTIRVHHRPWGNRTTLAELYQRPPARVAAFVLDCRDRCRELEDNDD